MKKGQVINMAVIGVAIISSGLTWLGNYILNSPAQAAMAIEAVKVVQIKDGNRITALETDTKTIKESQLQTQSDIKEILRILK